MSQVKPVEHMPYLVPTFKPGVKVPASMEGNPFFTGAIKEKAYAAAVASIKMFTQVYKTGVKIAFGTDLAVIPPW